MGSGPAVVAVLSIMGFRDLTVLRRHYAGQASQLVNEFYIPVLSQAVRYDRQAGYFDSASLVTQIGRGELLAAAGTIGQ